MTQQILDRIKETSTTAGTGALTLNGATVGMLPFSTIGNGNTCYYTIDDGVGNWEVGSGTYNSVGNSLARNTVYASSNGGSLVTFSSASKNVWLDAPAQLLAPLTQMSLLGGNAVAFIGAQYYAAKETATTAIDFSTGNVQYLQLVNNGQTLTFANPADGARYVLILKQPASGAAGTITWPTVKWASGFTPTLTATNGKVDIVTLIYDGTNTCYYGGASLNY